MKKYIVIISVFVILILVTSMFFHVTKKDIKLDNVEIKKDIKNNMFAMYKEVNGNYEEITNTNEFPEGYILNLVMSKCTDNNGNIIPNILSYNNTTKKVVVDTDKSVFCYLYFDVLITEWVFEYTGSEQRFTVPYTGTYKLEIWGAQGGSYNETYHGGYGAYSVGEINLIKDLFLYINIGGKPFDSQTNGVSITGGYNGGGDSVRRADVAFNAGGGATHIALDSGILSNLSSHASDNKILLVSGAGGGGTYLNQSRYAYGGNGGGYIGNNGHFNISSSSNCECYGMGGTQTSGGSYYVNPSPKHAYLSKINIPISGFGYGSSGDNTASLDSHVTIGGNGGGGGYFGGRGSSCLGGGGGGSGYIGNTNLTNKHMTCYNCEISNEEHTKTISNTCVNANPVSDCSKTGNGYAKITFID